MQKRILFAIGLILVLTIIAAALYILRPSEEASAPIEAVPINIDLPTKPEPEIKTENLEKPTTEQDLINTSSKDAMNGDTNGMIVFSIDQSDSSVSFTLDELLRNVPTTVIGSTNQVAGEIVIDVENPEKSQIGTILVNARTLATYNDFRNRAIKNEILKTGDFEFITFVPTRISGIPDNPQFGVEMVLQITGDLTIRDVTKETTFRTTITVASETQITGYASTMVRWSEFDITIPEVSSVADVDEEVMLEIEFSAHPK